MTKIRKTIKKEGYPEEAKPDEIARWPESDNQSNSQSEIEEVGDEHIHIKDEPTRRSPAAFFLVDWLIETIGPSAIEAIQHNPNFYLPYLDEEGSAQEWLARVVKTFFKPAEIDAIGLRLEEREKKQAEKLISLQLKCEELEANLVKITDKLTMANQQTEQLKIAKFKLEKQLRAQVPANDFINSIFGREEETAGIRHLLLEAIESGEDDVTGFLTAFGKSWSNLRECLNILPEEEMERLKKVDQELRQMLEILSGKFIAQRRALLDAIARYSSSFFSSFLFVSPEETLQVNPDIHQVVGTVGDRIKEGISFGIVRRANGQVYKYAEIITV